MRAHKIPNYCYDPAQEKTLSQHDTQVPPFPAPKKNQQQTIYSPFMFINSLLQGGLTAKQQLKTTLVLTLLLNHKREKTWLKQKCYPPQTGQVHREQFLQLFTRGFRLEVWLAVAKGETAGARGGSRPLILQAWRLEPISSLETHLHTQSLIHSVSRGARHT